MMKYSLSPREIPQASPLGFPSGSGYISLYILFSSKYRYNPNKNYSYAQKQCSEVVPSYLCVQALSKQWVINKPCVDGAVLQTPSSLID